MSRIFLIVALNLVMYDLTFAQVEQIYNTAEVEIKPQFPDGDAALFKYLSENLKFKSDDIYCSKIAISFIVTKSGEIKDIEIKRSMCITIDTQVLQLFKKMPNWKPGRFKGDPVSVRVIMPIQICLQG
jgi:periplasmic protein TonB